MFSELACLEMSASFPGTFPLFPGLGEETMGTRLWKCHPRSEKHTGYWGCHWGFSDHVITITRDTLRYKTPFSLGRQKVPTLTCDRVITSLASNSFF